MKNLYYKIVLIIGCFLRMLFGYFCMHFPQHDVWHKFGHQGYALYILNNLKLPSHNLMGFYHPPLNAIVQALFLRIVMYFKDYGNNINGLYKNCKYLAIIYSIITLMVIYKIISESYLKELSKKIAVTIISLYPGFIILTSQLGNDGLATMFFFISIYLVAKWYKEQKITTIILLALSIGFGMLTKISIGLVAFIVGPILLYKVFKNNKLMKHMIIFLIIVIPLGLSYSIRNLLLFDQALFSVANVNNGNPLIIDPNTYTIVDRIFSFPIERLFVKKYLIYHVPNEYNIWIDLIKTSTFDELTVNKAISYHFDLFIYILNVIFYITSILSIFYNLIIIVVKKRYEIYRIISILLFFIGITAFAIFNVKYYNSCSSNWRYIPFITFALTMSIVIFVNDIYVKKNS